VRSLKIAFAVVAVQRVGVVREMTFEEIDMAVEVVVAHADAHAGLFDAVIAKSRAALETFFAECAVAIVHLQKAGGGIAGYKYIRPAILVEVGGHR